MSILCALIAKNETFCESNLLSKKKSYQIVVEAGEGFTEIFPQAMKDLVLGVIPNDERSLLSYKDKYFLHILNRGVFVYACLTDEKYSKFRAQAFLTEVQEAFYSKVSEKEREKAVANSLNKSFSGILLEKMKHFNELAVDLKVLKIKQDAQETLKIMEENLEALMERGRIIETLFKKVQKLKVETNVLKDRSERLKKKARIDYLKQGMMMVAGVVATIIIL